MKGNSKRCRLNTPVFCFSFSISALKRRQMNKKKGELGGGAGAACLLAEDRTRTATNMDGTLYTDI